MFSLPASTDFYILHGEYSVLLVAISITIACCAAYTALFMNQRIQHASFFHKNFWLFLASIAMGLGIWAMHFIGMSAFMLPIAMKYDWLLTTISAIPAIFASYLAFYFASKPNKTQWSYIVAGIIMGLGISTMHYLGMAAMIMDAAYSYKPWLFFCSILVGIVASYIALYTFSTLQKYMGNQLVKIMTSILLGLAITSMHYTGMAAVVFYIRKPLPYNFNERPVMDASLLIIVVIVGIFLLLIIAGLTSLLDRYVDDRLRYFDALTLLPNQRQLERELYDVSTPGTLVILQIDQLEGWITNHGYTFGDDIIQRVGMIIQQKSPAFTKIYRIERNRFVMFQFGKEEHVGMKKSMSTILTILEDPLLVGDQYIVINATCAMAHSKDRGKNGKELFSNSLAVLKHPSSEGKHELIEYDPNLHTYTFERQIVRDIHRAMMDHELFLDYQPKIASKTREVAGLEALLRWNHPLYGRISPGIFIPILENNGEIFKVTDWVIEEVCQQIASWLKEEVPFHQVSINIPGSYLTSPKLLEVLNHSLSAHHVDSHYIELEITETSVIHTIENAITAANQYREMGISVALDDFGTGVSSLSYLKRLPITTIKIDKSFVDGVPASEKDSAVLDAIITLCYSLNLNVVIEGIESKEQMNFIASLNKNPDIQGYYFSKPLPAKEIAHWIWKGSKVSLRGS